MDPCRTVVDVPQTEQEISFDVTLGLPDGVGDPENAILLDVGDLNAEGVTTAKVRDDALHEVPYDNHHAPDAESAHHGDVMP
jgi:hypothetical protein